MAPVRSRLVLLRIAGPLAASLVLLESAALPIPPELLVDGFVVVEIDGLLVLIRLPMREVLL